MRLLIALLTIVIVASAGLSARASERVNEDLAAARQAVYGQDSVRTEGKDALNEAIIDLIKHELHRVQLAIERWGVDNSPYPPLELRILPHCVNQLVHPLPKYDVGPYIEPGFYANPLSPGEPGQPSAMCVPFGWSELSPGNFSYLTQINEYSEDVTGYVLVGYGPTRDSKWDLDGDGQPEGAVIVLGSGNLDYSQPLTLYDCGRVVTLTFVELLAE